MLTYFWLWGVFPQRQDFFLNVIFLLWCYNPLQSNISDQNHRMKAVAATIALVGGGRVPTCIGKSSHLLPLYQKKKIYLNNRSYENLRFQNTFSSHFHRQKLRAEPKATGEQRLQGRSHKQTNPFSSLKNKKAKYLFQCILRSEYCKLDTNTN